MDYQIFTYVIFNFRFNYPLLMTYEIYYKLIIKHSPGWFYKDYKDLQFIFTWFHFNKRNRTDHLKSVYIIHIMKKDSDLPCFQNFSVEAFKNRFMLNLTDEEVRNFKKSCHSPFTPSVWTMLRDWSIRVLTTGGQSSTIISKN